MLQRELPPGAYPDGPASAFYSTADMGATAKVLRKSYQNLERIYENYSPQSADEKLPDWEELILGKNLDASLTLAQRRDRVVAAIRKRRRTTKADMLGTVYEVIDSSILVEIVETGCSEGSWILDESILDISTILNGFNRLDFTGPDLCSFDAADFGLTEEEFLQMKEEAYTYEVRIYSYTLTAQELQDLDAALLKAEPARSRHVILDGLDPNDMIDGDT